MYVRRQWKGVRTVLEAGSASMSVVVVALRIGGLLHLKYVRYISQPVTTSNTNTRRFGTFLSIPHVTVSVYCLYVHLVPHGACRRAADLT